MVILLWHQEKHLNTERNPYGITRNDYSSHDAIIEAISEKGEAEIKIFVNGIECDAEALIKHWQDTMYKCIEDAAKEMIDDKIYEINNALEKIREKALDTMGINPWN